MPFIDPATCEPLRFYSRLEPRPRQPDFDRALRAELHDPLWLLARQWQFGEFKGEDAGSVVLAKVAVRAARIGQITAAGQVWDMAGDPLPLETHVERLPIAFDPVACAHAGRVLIDLVDARGAEFDAQSPATLYAPQRSGYRDAFRREFPFAPVAMPDADPDRALAATRVRSNPRAFAALTALAGRAVNGVALYRSLPAGPVQWPSLPATLAVAILPDHAELVRVAIEEFRDWFASTYSEPPDRGQTAWNSSQLEYQFTARVPRSDADASLVADEYDSGRLDWYAFDLGSQPAAPAASVAVDGGTSVFSVIPTPAEFPGMPRPRWWQLEDGSVDLGNIRAAATDVAKVLVAEFALLYGNNWFVIPCGQETGTLAEVEALVVTDVFGIRTLIRPVNHGSGSVWTAWDFFSLARREAPGVVASTIGAHLFVPPSLTTVDEGAPVESVSFLRDEMSNLVWAVETRVPDGLGRGRDGNDAARQLRNALVWLAEDLDQAAGVTHPPAPENAPPLRFVLGTTVPENWIPLVPVHKPLNNRAIRLQRASMPRFFRGDVRPVRPTTAILRTGLAADERQLAPWFLEEEEVPREGTVVESSFQRARWINGRTVVWLGRRARTGRGVGGSGLRYDLVEKGS